MLIQLIFFLAVALTLALLVRRARLNKPSSQGQSAFNTQKFTYYFKAILGNLGPIFMGLVKKLNKRSFSKRNESEVFSGQDDESGKFWQGEGVAGQFELTSNYDEGEKLLKDGKLAEAEQLFLKAAASNPSDSKVYAKLGLIYLTQENYSDAIESLKIAVKHDKHNPSRHYNLALAFWGNKDVQRATVAIREAISLDPVTPKYRQLLEQLLNREQKKK